MLYFLFYIVFLLTICKPGSEKKNIPGRYFRLHLLFVFQAVVSLSYMFQKGGSTFASCGKMHRAYKAVSLREVSLGFVRQTLILSPLKLFSMHLYLWFPVIHELVPLLCPFLSTKQNSRTSHGCPGLFRSHNKIPWIE